MTSASPETGRTVRVSIVPHRTQAWVTSLRSFDSVPLAIRVRVIGVITIWRPQCVQGRRKVGSLEGATSLYCMELFHARRPDFTPGRILRECQQVFVRRTQFVRRDTPSAGPALARDRLRDENRSLSACPESDGGVKMSPVAIGHDLTSRSFQMPEQTGSVTIELPARGTVPKSPGGKGQP
jgi:hypothetical protein